MKKKRDLNTFKEEAAQAYEDWSGQVINDGLGSSELDVIEEEHPLSLSEEQENSTPQVVVVKKIDVNGVSVITRPMTAKELKAFEESRGV